MNVNIGAIAAVTDTATITAQIAALQAQLRAVEQTKIETVSIPFFVHNGSPERPANIPADARVIYFHTKDNALCVTHAAKRKQWSDVGLYIWVSKEQFRSFVKSRSKKAI